MFSVPHLVVIFIVVLVVFGPHKLPELARSLGKMMAEFRKASTDFKMAFEEEMRTIERQAREVEFKKAQDAAAAAVSASTEQQPATFATPAEAETPHIPPESILPERGSVPEPVISPVTEAVSRESHFSDEATAAGEPLVTEGTPAPDAGVPASDSAEPGELPAHDHRQPA
jgi:sec-independent protein translocase protein TatB